MIGADGFMPLFNSFIRLNEMDRHCELVKSSYYRKNDVQTNLVMLSSLYGAM